MNAKKPMQKRIIETHSPDTESPYTGRRKDDYEIKLAELWLVIHKRRLWLLAGLLCGVAAAIAYTILTPTTYESRATVHIGKVHEIGPIEDLDALAILLMDRYGPEASSTARAPFLRQASKVSGHDNILRLVAVGYTAEEARAHLAQIVENVMEQHQRLYAHAIDPFRQRIAEIEQKIAPLAAQLEDYNELIANLRESHPVQASLLAIERADAYTRLAVLENDRAVLQQQIVQPFSTPTEVVARAVLPREPVAPKPLAYIVVGAVLGLLLGSFAALVKEFLLNIQAAKRSL